MRAIGRDHFLLKWSQIKFLKAEKLNMRSPSISVYPNNNKVLRMFEISIVTPATFSALQALPHFQNSHQYASKAQRLVVKKVDHLMLMDKQNWRAGYIVLATPQPLQKALFILPPSPLYNRNSVLKGKACVRGDPFAVSLPWIADEVWQPLPT